MEGRFRLAITLVSCFFFVALMQYVESQVWGIKDPRAILLLLIVLVLLFSILIQFQNRLLHLGLSLLPVANFG